MNHYITGYRPEEDEQVFKVRLLLNLSNLRKIMQWKDDGECVFDNKLSTLQAAVLGKVSGVQLPDGLDLYLTTESD